MGKRIRVQRRGRGASTWRALTHKRIDATHYPALSKKEMENFITGRIEEILHEPGRGSPLALVKLENGQDYYTVIPEGVYRGQKIQMGSKAAVDIGNIITLGDIPPGTLVSNIELKPGDGGKICRSSGTYATLVAHTPIGTMLKFPSGKTTYLNNLCRAMIGVIAGAGRPDKPFLKAGAKFHLMRAKGRKYPRTRGVAMVSAMHPYGSSKRGGRKTTTTSRNAPPGRKIGLIAARGTGRRRKRTIG